MMNALTTALMAGTGVALLVSVWLWPRTTRPDRQKHHLRDLLAQGQLQRVSPAGFVTVSLLTALLLAATALALSGVSALACLAGVAGALAPIAALRNRAIARSKQLRTLWPDVIDQLVAAVRSGMGLADALTEMAASGPEPIRPGFAAFAATYRSTACFRTAAGNAKDVLADPIADRLLVTLQMAHEVGGTQLVPVLRTFAAHLRESQAVRHEVEARQGWVTNAARLGVVAPWVVLLLLVTRPEAAAAYNTPQGSGVIAVGAGVSLIAYRLMLRLGRLPDEQRWFA